MFSGDSIFEGDNSPVGGGGAFPSPFSDLSSMAIPTEPRNALRWCELVWRWTGIYQQAHTRILSYFLTDYVVTALDRRQAISTEDKDKWEILLTDQIRLPVIEYRMNMDKACYGNAFASVNVPFDRFLICSNCGSMTSFERVGNNIPSKLKYESGKFYAGCMRCGKHCEHSHEDKVHSESDRIYIKIWSVHEIFLKHDIYSEETQYWWRIPDDYIQKVRRNDVFTLARANMKVLQAIDEQKLFKFKKDAIFHMKEPTISGVKNRGWGISRIISSFKQIWYVQLLYKHNEVIAQDYVVPFRLITPAGRQGANEEASDPFYSMNLSNFTSQIDAMVKRRRRDPASHFSLPFPVEYQVLGGEAKQLAPVDMLNAGVNDLLDATGIPAEMYRGTMRLEHAPLAARIFESTWRPMVHMNDEFVGWVVGRVAKLLSWEQVSVKHRRVTIADDLQKQMALLQLSQQGDVSRTTALYGLGTTPTEERRRIMEEQLEDMRLQSEMESEMENRAFMEDIAKGEVVIGGPPAAQPPVDGGQGMPPGAMPPPGGAPPGGDPAAAPQYPMMPGMNTGSLVDAFAPNGVPEDLTGLQSLAQQIAHHLLYAVPETMKDSELRKLKQDPRTEMLHMLVRKFMDEMRSQNKQEGGVAVQQQIQSQVQGGGGF